MGDEHYQGGGGAIATQGMPFHIGMEMALAFKFSAQRCYEVGLINRVVPDSKLMDEAKAMATHIVHSRHSRLKLS